MKQELILNDVWTDWLTNGIFQIIDEHYNIPWENDIDSRLLDMEYYGNRSGTKKIAPLLYYLLDQDGITAANKRTLADLCWKKFNKNWSALWNTLNFEYDPISNYDMVETEGTTAGSTTDANSGIYGFNSQQASPSDTSHSTTNGNENRTLTRKGNIGVTTSQQMIQSERDLWMWKFYEQLFADVDTVLVTAVFGCSNRDYLTVIAQAGYKLPIATETVLGGVKPASKTEDMTLSVGVDENGRLWVQSGGSVDSVNGKTGIVVLNYDDVGAPSLDEFQQIEEDTEDNTTAINQLWQRAEDIAQELESKYSPSNVPPYPVTSVNGMTGDVTVEGGGGGPDYSTEEQDTGLKWIDGRTVYQKTYHGTASGGQNYTIFQAGFSSDNELIGFEGWYGEYSVPFYSSGTFNSYLTSTYNGTALAILYGSSYRGKTYTVTVRYVKK